MKTKILIMLLIVISLVARSQNVLISIEVREPQVFGPRIDDLVKNYETLSIVIGSEEGEVIMIVSKVQKGTPHFRKDIITYASLSLKNDIFKKVSAKIAEEETFFDEKSLYKGLKGMMDTITFPKGFSILVEDTGSAKSLHFLHLYGPQILFYIPPTEKVKKIMNHLKKIGKEKEYDEINIAETDILYEGFLKAL